MMLCACTALYTVGCSSDEGMDGKEDGNCRSTTGQAVTFTNKAETATTRTAISYTKGNAANVLWSAGDKIWVEDNTNNFVQSLAGVFSADMKVGKFSVTGTFPATTQVHYTGGASATTVTIANNQTQAAANDFAHAGAVGDCAVGTASGSATAGYQFTLNHKAAYLCLLPRSENSLIRGFVIQDVTVIADNDIAGDFSLSASGLSATPSANGSKSIKVTVPNLPLTNATSPATNAIYVVMAPQTTALNIVYHLYNPALNFSGTITKNIPVQAYAPGTIRDITSKLGNDYTEEQKPYLWDAKKWVFDGQTEPYNMAGGGVQLGPSSNPMLPQSKASDPDRWYNDELPGVAKNSCKDCPNGYQMVWYGTHYPYFDAEELWTAEGKLYKGVLRFRKWNTLVADFGASKTSIPTTLPPSTTAWEDGPGIPNGNNFNIGQGIPAPSDMTKYFALPAALSSVAHQNNNFYAGKYASLVDDTNSYWASSARPDGTLWFGGIPTACYLTYAPGGSILWVSTGNYIERTRLSARFAIKFQ